MGLNFYDCAYVTIGLGGLLLILLGVWAIFKTHQSSQSRFAYKLMGFTVGFGIYQIVTAITQFVPLDDVSGGVLCFLLSFQFFWLILQLQTWEFAIKYFESAMKCVQNPCISSVTIQKVRIGVEIIYTIAILSGLVLFIVFYVNLQKVEQHPAVQFAIIGLWLLMIATSALLIVFSLTTLGVTIRRLKQSGTNIKFNFWQMTVHSLACLLQLVACFNFVFNSPGPKNLAICLLLDLVCQLLVIYIVRTQGSNPQLRKYACVMTKDEFGDLKLVFRAKAGVSGERFSSFDSHINRESFSDEIDQDVPNESFVQDVDEIMEQFMQGLDEEMVRSVVSRIQE